MISEREMVRLMVKFHVDSISQDEVAALRAFAAPVSPMQAVCPACGQEADLAVGPFCPRCGHDHRYNSKPARTRAEEWDGVMERAHPEPKCNHEYSDSVKHSEDGKWRCKKCGKPAPKEARDAK